MPARLTLGRKPQLNNKHISDFTTRTTHRQFEHTHEQPQLTPPNMDAVLRQSKAMCPFMKKASPATLRALSTSTRPAAKAASSPCGGTMSRLQGLAYRCPVMGKALAVQSAKVGGIGASTGIAGLSARSVSTKHAHGSAHAHGPRMSKRCLHGSRSNEARAVETPVIPGREKGEFVAERSLLVLGLSR